ncbi:MAG: hypothetical protein KBB52_07360 [Candidatus Omnitrophica bacterium]|nr:hypothetical protein [Candidatus Omnitrophota bacterium]
MIVPMKKAAIILQAKDTDDAVAKLRRLGVLHIEHQEMPQGKDIASLKDDIAVITRVIDILSIPEFSRNRNFRISKHIDDWRLAAHHIADLYSRFDQLQEYSHRMKNDVTEWERWGDFDPESVTSLEKKGVFLRLYDIPVKEMSKIPEEVILKKCSVSSGIVKCAIVSRKKTELPFKEIPLPKMSLSKMRARIAEDLSAIHTIKEDIRKYTQYKDRFVKIREAFEKELEFHEAKRGMGRSGAITYIVGYIPYDAAAKLLSKAKAERWGATISEPSENDLVPTLIRNPRWISIISPVFRMIGIVPGYRELDTSMWFLIFFSVFFGMLIGDAGYGIIFFVLTAAAQFKFGYRIKDKSPFILLYILSSCAIVWGVLSGTYFGQEWLPQSVKPLVPALRNDKSVQSICFFIGALHLTIGRLWRAVLKWPSLDALSDVGWAVILWGGFYLAKLLILSEPLPSFAKWLFISGAVLVLFFTSPNKNPLKALAGGAGSLALNFMNSFTDVVSYIRLFAVGLATVAVADSFNKMASEVGWSNLIAGLVASLILVIGHVLNLLLGPLSIIVHGVRLNVLEFCSHADIKWSGFSYSPLKTKLEDNEKR